jgi:hypothetical protein
VSQRIVDFLETVEVEEEQGKLSIVSFRRGEDLVQPIEQQRAIGKTGKLVVIRKVVGFRDLPLALVGELLQLRVRFGQRRHLLLGGERLLSAQGECLL